MDSFVSATPEISKIIEKNDYKISQTVAVEERYYGILVRDMNLTECFRKEIYYETGWYESDHIYDIITERIDADSKVQKYVLFNIDFILQEEQFRPDRAI